MNRTEGGREITLLHVDDDDEFAERVAEFLEGQTDDITVLSTRTPEAALAELGSNADVDCVVSDHDLPRTDGLELLETVRDRWPDLPFVLFTAHGDERTAIDAIDLGVTDYLRKTDGTSQYLLLANRVRNLVARTRAEETLQRQADRTDTQFELLVDAVEDYAIFLLDEEGYVRTWNRGAEKIKGYAEGEIVGEHFSTFYREEDVEAGVPDRNLADAADAERVHDEGWRVRADGSEFWADVTITALRDGGELVGFAKVTRDATKTHQERLVFEQNEQLRHLITSISHDLKNPLNVAVGNVELAVDHGDLSYLEGTERALDRVNELLDYLSKLAVEGDQLMDLEPVHLREVVDASWDAVGGDDAGLSVEDEVVVADRHQFQQLLENLLANARKHGGSGVRVGVGPLDDHDGIYVEDDGPGIPEADREAVFEVGHSEEEGGTGFGLAICRQIAEAHGWTIVATDGPDGGARFEVRGVTLGTEERPVTGPE